MIQFLNLFRQLLRCLIWNINIIWRNSSILYEKSPISYFILSDIIKTQLTYNLQTYFDVFGFAQIYFIEKKYQIFKVLLIQFFINSFQKNTNKSSQRKIEIISASSIITVWISLFIIHVNVIVISKIFYKIKCKFFSESEIENQLLVKLSFQYNIQLLSILLIFILYYHFRTLLQTLFTKYFYQLQLFFSLHWNYNISFSHLLYYLIRNTLLNANIKREKMRQFFERIELNQFPNIIKQFSQSKTIFMILLIFTFEFSIFQIGGITFLSISMILYLFKYVQLQDKSEYLKQLFVKLTFLQHLLV
ncbi:unnamed protein product [Paramecium sonneborni]|uniref:Transmembrane protein n=1 Tax=Paramecium sonneborni TaxID=65129 RepID=A0A8S1RJP3_9CILI|nr:unnamed protein product [Paramecium sonneborni]